MSDVALLPKLPINGRSADEESTRLHFKKNQPEQPDIEFPPYVYRPYPAAMYREWDEATRRREIFKIANLRGFDLSDPHQLDQAEDALPEFESVLVGQHDYDAQERVVPALRAQNDKQYAQMKAAGWAETPAQIRAVKDRQNKTIALAAAERAYDDRRLADKARRELDAIENAADDHVVEVPAPKKKPGRPAKRKPETDLEVTHA